MKKNRLAPGLFFALAFFFASAEAMEFGVGFGPFLPSRIGGVREILNGWALRGGVSTAKGFFELEHFNGHGDGINYHTSSFDYRLDVVGSGAMTDITVHFILGFHADYYQPSFLDTTLDTSYRWSGGWHYGGGLRLPLGGPLSLRADFKQRFSPGQSLTVLVGLGFALGADTSAAAGAEPTP